MSNAVTNRCRYAVLPPPAKSVLMCLSDRADDLGDCWPAQSYICRWTCYGRTAVINAVRHLEELGLITVSRENGRANRTTINLEAVDAYVLQQSKTSPPPQPVRATDSQQSGSRTAPVRVAHQTSPPTTHKTSGSSYIKRGKSPLPDEWAPNAELLAWARSSRPDLTLHSVVETFRNHYIATGDTRADWDACFRTWLLRERKHETDASPKPASLPTTTGRDPALVKIEADARLAVPPTALQRARLAQLRNSFAGASNGSQS